MRRWLVEDPVRRKTQAPREQANIKAMLARARIPRLFLPRQKIKKQCRESRAIEHLGHESIARTAPAAAAAVRKNDHATRVLRKGQIADQGDRAGIDFDFFEDHHSPSGYVSGNS